MTKDALAQENRYITLYNQILSYFPSSDYVDQSVSPLSLSSYCLDAFPKDLAVERIGVLASFRVQV